MEKFYYLDPYCREIDTKIIKVWDGEKPKHHRLVQLEQTIFYPEAGGQPGDRGKLYINDESFSIIDTQKSQNKEHVIHIIKDPKKLIKEGAHAKIELDWPFRYSYMQKHTAQHVLSALFMKAFNLPTVATHLGKDLVTIEIETNNISLDKCYRIEEMANNVVRLDKKVTYQELPHLEAEKLNLRRSIKVQGLVRIVSIEDYDLIACGGIHTNSTSEIKLITYVGQEKIRSHIRTIWKVADDAISSIHENSKIISNLCSYLSAQSFELEPLLSNIQQSLLQERQQNNTFCVLLAELLIEKMANNEINIIQLNEKYSLISLKCFKEVLKNQDKTVCVIIKKQERWEWIIHVSSKFASKMDNFKKKVLINSKAKGGGRFPFFQGIVDVHDADFFCNEFRSYFKNIYE